VEEEEEVLRRAKRDWSSLRWPPPPDDDGFCLGGGGGEGRFLSVAVAVAAAVSVLRWFVCCWEASLLVPPIPRPGTETPAAARRLIAPWLRRPFSVPGPVVVGVSGGVALLVGRGGGRGRTPAEEIGDAEFVRGGSLGGRLGGPGFAPTA